MFFPSTVFPQHPPIFETWENFCVDFFFLISSPVRKCILNISSVQFSCSVVSSSLWPHGLQLTRPPCPSLSPGVFWNSSALSVMPLNHLVLCCPLLLLPQIFLSQHQGLFQWVGSLHQVAKVLELQLPHQSFQWIFRVDSLRMVQGTLKSLLQDHS